MSNAHSAVCIHSHLFYQNLSRKVPIYRGIVAKKKKNSRFIRDSVGTIIFKRLGRSYFNLFS